MVFMFRIIDYCLIGRKIIFQFMMWDKSTDADVVSFLVMLFPTENVRAAGMVQY